MNFGRRIAAALLTAAVSLGTVGLVAGPADAKDTTWPARYADPTPTHNVAPTMRDTTWPS